jgi:phospholipid-binding lipoprotein MlaA
MRGLLCVGLATLILCGCATEGVSVRRLPDETPAADNAAAIARMQAASAAAAGGSATGIGATGARATGASAAGAGATQGGYAATGGPPTPQSASYGEGGAPSTSSASSDEGDANAPPPLTPADAPSMYTYDPLERINRFTYRFNARFDEHVFLPVANGYRRIPATVRSSVHNFFRNLAEIPSTVNYGLQWRLGNSARSLGRFVINSTLGIGGLFDVASRFKLSDDQTGFGATLATWGVHPGPYLVIPLLGPSTLRDGTGFLGDYVLDYGINIVDLYRGYQSYGLGVVNAVDQRANIDFRYYGSGSPFEYETIRFLYVHRDLIQDEALRARGRHKKQDPGQPAGK